MSTDPIPCGAGFFHRWRCARRISDLERLINTSRMIYVGWAQEIAYIRRTGRLDWVDPNVPAVRPAGDHPLPPPPQPRPDVSVVFQMISRG